MLVATTVVACSLLTNLGDLDRTLDASVGGDGGMPDAAPDGGPPPFDASFDAIVNDAYSLSVPPDILVVDPGTSGQVVVTAVRNGFNGPITITGWTLPFGVSVTPDPATMPGSTVTLTFNAASSAVAGGPYAIQILASSSVGPANTTLKLRVDHVIALFDLNGKYVAPDAATPLVFKVWGAGGGGGCDQGNSDGGAGSGGAGGFASGQVTLAANESLTVTVGTGGGAALGAAGGGGGYSAVARGDGGVVLLAGGGGGGGCVGSGSHLDGANGGAGGGPAGAAGSSAESGQGGAVSGGLGGLRNPVLYSPGINGLPYVGGDGWKDPFATVAGGGLPGGGHGGLASSFVLGGGGGGGGYRGGGGGAGGDNNAYLAGGGGGGSGFLAPSVDGGALQTGTAKQPPATADKSYGVGVAVGGNPAPTGNAAAGSRGGNGRVVILYP